MTSYYRAVRTAYSRSVSKSSTASQLSSLWRQICMCVGLLCGLRTSGRCSLNNWGSCLSHMTLQTWRE